MKTGDVNYIMDLLNKPESSTLEFKAVYSKNEIAKVICSFLNKDGGRLIIGVEENQKINGIKNAEKLAAEIQTFLFQEIIPEPVMSVDIQKVKNKELLVIAARQGTNQPYIFDGAVYYRKGSTTIKADSRQLSQLIHNESERNYRWEIKPAIEVEVEDIDLNEVQTCIKETKKSGREISIPDNPLQFLSKYGLYKNGDFTNAAVILFGKNPVQFFPQVRVRLSAFKTDKTGYKLLYDKIFEKNLFQSINQITDFFDLAYGFSSSFEKNHWKRYDNASFPRLAIREAILNAFVHRDYSSFSSSIAINIYPDKLEISSYGSLPKGISVKSLSEDHMSIPVNPSMAHVFFLRNWIEKIGIGTVKMIAHCNELGFKPPVWKHRDNTVTVTFPNVIVPFNYDEGISEGISEGIDNLISIAQSEGISKGISKGITDDVRNSLVEIVNLIIKEETLRASEIANKLVKPYKTIERHIKALREIGAIEFMGSKRAGGYVVTESLRNKVKK